MRCIRIVSTAVLRLWRRIVPEKTNSGSTVRSVFLAGRQRRLYTRRTKDGWKASFGSTTELLHQDGFVSNTSYAMGSTEKEATYRLIFSVEYALETGVGIETEHLFVDVKFPYY